MIAGVSWAPPEPTLTVAAAFADQYEYAVHVYETTDGRRLVAAVEIVSPANKDRPDHRRLFTAKCATLVAQGVCVAIVDLVTTRHFNLYSDLLELIGEADPALAAGPPPQYGAVCRLRRQRFLARAANSATNRSCSGDRKPSCKRSSTCRTLPDKSAWPSSQRPGKTRERHSPSASGGSSS